MDKWGDKAYLVFFFCLFCFPVCTHGKWKHDSHHKRALLLDLLWKRCGRDHLVIWYCMVADLWSGLVPTLSHTTHWKVLGSNEASYYEIQDNTWKYVHGRRDNFSHVDKSTSVKIGANWWWKVGMPSQACVWPPSGQERPSVVSTIWSFTFPTSTTKSQMCLCLRISVSCLCKKHDTATWPGW